MPRTSLRPSGIYDEQIATALNKARQGLEETLSDPKSALMTFHPVADDQKEAIIGKALDSMGAAVRSLATQHHIDFTRKYSNNQDGLNTLVAEYSQKSLLAHAAGKLDSDQIATVLAEQIKFSRARAGFER